MVISFLENCAAYTLPILPFKVAATLLTCRVVIQGVTHDAGIFFGDLQACRVSGAFST